MGQREAETHRCLQGPESLEVQPAFALLVEVPNCRTKPEVRADSPRVGKAGVTPDNGSMVRVSPTARDRARWTPHGTTTTHP